MSRRHSSAYTRGTGTWEDFTCIHAKTLWACAFFSKKVWTTKGLVEYFVLFYILLDEDGPCQLEYVYPH